MRKIALLVAGIVFVSACSGSDVVDPPQSGPLAALTVVEGPDQSGTVGEELAQPLGVKALDADGRAIAGQLVVFTVTSGGGAVFAGTVQTGGSGEARDRWTLGTSTGVPQVVRARAVDPQSGFGAEVEFNATALAGAPTALAKVAGDGQRALGGTQLPIPLSALVQDAFGNPVPSSAVDFSVTSGGGQVSPESSETNEAGVASTWWTLGETGVQEVRAALPEGDVATFSADLASRELIWQSLAAMPFAVRAATATTDGSKIYVFGGWTTEATNYTQIYDVATGTWSTGTPVPANLAYGMAAASSSGIHLMGGSTNPSNKFTSHYIYSPQTDSWSTRASLPQGLDGGAAMTWEGRLYVFGGNHGGAAVSATALVYDPQTDQWSTLQDMPTARLSPAGALYAGAMVVSGGWASDGLQVVESFDPSSGWRTTLPSLPDRRETHASAVVDGRLCVAGGRRYRGAPKYSSTYCLASAQAGWVAGPSMPIPLDEVAYVELDGALYIFGGNTSDVSAGVYRLSVETR